MNTNLKPKENNKKIIPIVISTISHFWSPYPNKFLVFCICILIFHGVYSLLPTNMFFWWTNFFLCLVARDWEDFKFLEDLLYWERPIFFFGRGMLDHFLPIKQSMTNHVNSRTVDRKIICFMCAW